MMRAAIKEDEWMLYLHGAVMGMAGGFLHLAIFGVSGVMSDDPETVEGELVPPEPPERHDGEDIDLPGLAALAANAALKTAEWSARAYVGAARAPARRRRPPRPRARPRQRRPPRIFFLLIE